MTADTTHLAGHPPEAVALVLAAVLEGRVWRSRDSCLVQVDEAAWDETGGVHCWSDQELLAALRDDLPAYQWAPWKFEHGATVALFPLVPRHP